MELKQMNEPTRDVPLGDLMKVLDMSNRWVYHGSVTHPPCKQEVYWNVLQTVYPIKSNHLNQFKAHQSKRNHLRERGNYRVTQALDE